MAKIFKRKGGRRGSGRSYFSTPRGFNANQFNRLGENTRLHRGTALFLMIFLGITVYVTMILPGLTSLECGIDYDNAHKEWQDGFNRLYVDVEPIDGGYVAYTAAYVLSQTIITSYIEDDEDLLIYAGRGPAGPVPDIRAYGGPECAESVIPTGKRHHQVYQVLISFLAILMLIPILFLIFRQMGTVSALPALLLALVLREIIPGDGILDWIIMTIGILIACIPVPVAGLLAAVMHLGALALWPLTILSYSQSLKSVEHIIDFPLQQALEIAVWVIPFGLLVLMPVRWKMVDNEVVT